MVEVMRIKEISFKSSMLTLPDSVPQLCSRPLPIHSSARDSWTLMGKSGSGSCGVTAPCSWVLVHKVVCALQESVSPVLCKFWWLYSGLMATSSKRAYAIPTCTALRAPAPAAVHC